MRGELGSGAGATEGVGVRDGGPQTSEPTCGR